MDAWRTHGLVVTDKFARVAAYHEKTVDSFLAVLSACGLEQADQLAPYLLHRRVTENDVQTYCELFPYLRSGELLDGTQISDYRDWWDAASADRF